ncbi:MAG TPA: DUF302 domain-containing protein [Bacteroidales bacterium]|nr:DUF302 domain-containing protein [Bacteroidales bacterium]
MEYFFSKILSAGFEDSISRVVECLKTEGFGIVSEIDMQAKIKEKLNKDIRKYRILGACNPSFAYMALQSEEKIGVMLPCNVVVIDRENGTTEVAAVDPMASMMAIQNPDLANIAFQVTEKLKSVVNKL